MNRQDFINKAICVIVVIVMSAGAIYAGWALVEGKKQQFARQAEERNLKRREVEALERLAGQKQTPIVVEED